MKYDKTGIAFPSQNILGKICLIAWMITFMATAGWAQEAQQQGPLEPGAPPPVDIWVRANPIESNESSADVISFNESELTDLAGANLTTALSNHAGLMTIGQPGNPQNLAIRGLGNGAVLIVVDGVPVNDPSNPDRSFDLSGIDMSRVVSLRVYKGPQVSRFGYGALAGVVDIRTSRQDAPVLGFSPEASLSYGSFNTARARLGTNWRGDRGQSVSIGLTSARSDGYAVVDAPGAEAKPWEQFGTHGRLQTPLGEHWLLNLGSRYDDRRQKLALGPGQDATRYHHREFAAGLDLRLDGYLVDDRWNPYVQWTSSSTRRRYLNDVDPGDVSYLRENYSGRNQALELGQQWHMTPSWQWGISIGQEVEEADFPDAGGLSQKEREERPFVRAGFRSEEEHVYELDLGLRTYRQPKDGKAYENFHAETSLYILPPLSVELGVHRAHRFASLYQRHAPIYGNADLKTEISDSHELGMKHRWRGGGALVLSWYEARYQQLIDFDGGTSRFGNIAEARSRGWELENRMNLNPAWEIGLNGTLARSWDPASGHELARRPEEKWGLMTNWQFNPKWTTRWDVIHVGSRWNDNSRSRRLAAYSSVNGSLGWKVREGMSLHLRSENVANRSYQEAWGYRAPGRTWNLQWNWNG